MHAVSCLNKATEQAPSIKYLPSIKHAPSIKHTPSIKHAPSSIKQQEGLNTGLNGNRSTHIWILTDIIFNSTSIFAFKFLIHNTPKSFIITTRTPPIYNHNHNHPHSSYIQLQPSELHHDHTPTIYNYNQLYSSISGMLIYS